MKENKNHWYDGFFYDNLIAPNQDKSFELIREIIGPDKTILDAGCGTGRFAFQIADKCRLIDSVDLSSRNIQLAHQKLSSADFPNVRFHHSDLLKFLGDTETHYDYSTLSYVIHEVDPHLRVEIIKRLAEKSDYLIIADYLVPRIKGFWSALNEVVEFAAGREHYRNFKSYVRENGVYGLAEKSGLKIKKEIKNVPSTSHIAVLIKN